MKRPNLRPYFAARIDHCVRGMLSTARADLPADVARLEGTVTDRRITATMRDGTVWHWRGGRYASRKVNGCYAPLQPQPVAEDAL